MARDLNRVLLIGRITQDLELKKLEGGNSVVNFSLATNRVYTNKEGQKVEEAEFHRCVAFGKTAEMISTYLSKGRRVFIEGRLRTRKWEDNQGVTRYTTEIIVEDIIFLDSKKDFANSSTAEEPNPILNSDSSTSEEEIPF